MHTVNDLLVVLEELAPSAYQEKYDNSRLITGSPLQEISGVLVSLDCVEDTIEEAIHRGCNVVISHHPILFTAIKSITGSNYVERTLIKAIKNDIVIIAIHTNLDNVIKGVNNKIAEKIGLENTRILSPQKELLQKLYTYVPTSHTEVLLEALFKAGAGQIGQYSECSFSILGTGTYKASEKANPFLGEKGKRHAEKEDRVEVLFPKTKQTKILSALRAAHPYEEIAYEIITLDNVHQEVGAGLIGELNTSMATVEFLEIIKKRFNCGSIRHSKLIHQSIKKVALCGGAGSFLITKARNAGADIYLTADLKYHEFFEHENQIILADIGHYESEQFTTEIIIDEISKFNPNFAVLKSELNTNPVCYF